MKRSSVMRHRIALLFWAPILLGTLFVSGRSVGPLPALGPFLEPVRGVWSVAAAATMQDSARATISGLEGNVEVVYDDRGVPHIFAGTRRDAIRALGYVVARDRLFQLEMQTRATAGTLSEVAGSAALSADRQSRGIGLAWAAGRDYATIDPTSEVAHLLAAYSDGVNAWIDNMTGADIPIEFRLLNAHPSRWEPEHSLYLLKRMGWTLSYVNIEHTKDRVAAVVGREAADALFPVNAPIQDPIQTNGLDDYRVEAAEIPPPGPPDTDAVARLQGTTSALAPSDAENASCSIIASFDCAVETAIGSNNWAIGPLKSVTGNAILAGDPHLNLTLPSIWYEVHLVVPGELDAYGVTIPGTPGIVIGFNRDVAWTFTNTGADVLDFYDEMFDNAVAPTQYMVDGAWRPLEPRVEAYRDERDRVIHVDTIYHTHRGPVLRGNGRNLSIRWTVLDGQGEQDAFNRVVTTSTVDEWLLAMEPFVAPAQNGLVADRQGSIAIRAHGRFPIRPQGMPGDEIFDGTTSTSDWTGYWPVSRYPYSIDPARAFLSSANQQPIDPRAEAGYLGADWPSPWRAMHINGILRQDSSFTADDMRRLQTDAGSARADFFTPFFLNAGERALQASTDQDTTLGQALRLLGDWNRRYTTDNDRAILFELAMSELANQTWDELRNDERRVATPASHVLAALMNDSTSTWWDDRDTAQRETRDSILARSLRAAFILARRQYGAEDGEGWTWSTIRNANIFHLLRLPGLSELNIPVQGGPSTLSPLSGAGTHGASWRMVVELGDTVGAWVTYPGGQSGNPASRFYTDRIREWAAGELSIPLFPESIDRLPADRVVSRLALRGTN